MTEPLALQIYGAGVGDIASAAAASVVLFVPPGLLYGYFRGEVEEGMRGYRI